jgi:endonuclease/exonuclease/phosphatase family metal-dependent hydrolase
MKFRPLYISLVPLAAALGIFLLIRTTCGVQTAPATKVGLRVATYNIAWFGEDAHPERIANIKSVLNRVDADVYGLQEIASRKALDQIFDSNWEIGIADDPSEPQETAIAVKKPLKIQSVELVFEGRNLDDAFPGKRDVLRAVVATPSGEQITFYVVHLKSRSGGRLNTDQRRIFACALLAAYIRGKNEPFVVALGDFNDTPDDESVNILESGDLRAKAGMAPTKDPFMHNITEPLWAQDYVTIELRDRFRGSDMVARAEGARRENDRLRGIDYRFPDDVNVREIMFDQILVSPKMFQVYSGTAGVYAGADALRGRPPQVRRGDSGFVRYDDKGTLASDHLPVYADFRLQAR